MGASETVRSLIRLESIPRAFGAVALILLMYFFSELFRIRMKFRRMAKKHGIPLMEHNLLFGHLIKVAKVIIKQKLPADLHPQLHISILQQAHPELAKHGLLYMDVWPMGWEMVAVWDPDMLAQFIQDNSLPKFWGQGHKFKPLTNTEDVIHLEGKEWKAARAMFNPGFSSRNIMAMIPMLVEEVEIFRSLLRKAAERGQRILLEDMTVRLTADIISRITINARLNLQTTPEMHTIMHYLDKQLAMIAFRLDLRKQVDPFKWVKRWWYARVIRKSMTPFVKDIVEKYDADTLEGPKSVVSLAYKEYVQQNDGESITGAKLDAFVYKIIKHVKIFMFAGHDTTATTLAMALHLIDKYPEIGSKLREEHDRVLGPDPNEAPRIISADPTVLNQLPYTQAIFKETLRLFPPVGGSIRESHDPSFMLTHPKTGQRYPIYGLMVHSSCNTTMRDPDLWTRATEFLPERWMVRDEKDPLYPPKNGWRPFEMGPRACIGQELANVEIKVALALTAREFACVGDYEDGAESWEGLQAYQCESNKYQSSAHIKDKLPSKIVLRQ